MRPGMKAGSRWAGPCLLLLAGCATVPDQPPPLVVEDIPQQNMLRISNRSNRQVTLHYNYGASFGDLQMFFIRIRDRNGQILDLGGSPDGWFTPRGYSGTLYRRPPRRRLVVPARGTVDLGRNVSAFTNWVRWDGPRDGGPCEIQFRLFGYIDNDPRRPLEALTTWQPGPCPF